MSFTTPSTCSGPIQFFPCVPRVQPSKPIQASTDLAEIWTEITEALHLVFQVIGGWNRNSERIPRRLSFDHETFEPEFMVEGALDRSLDLEALDRLQDLQ